MRVAAIDCGTNSIRLLIADIDGNNFREVVRDMEIVRLGQGVDETGQFHPDAIARTLAAVDKFAAEIAKRGVEKIRFCATSATRDATNRHLFVDGVRDRLSIELEVISGDEEAAHSFAGAIKDLDPSNGPFLVVDIGGGSTELVLVSTDGASFTEVTVSRTLFRTGESEYAINGVGCRLLDVQELLSDAIRRDSGHRADHDPDDNHGHASIPNNHGPDAPTKGQVGRSAAHTTPEAVPPARAASRPVGHRPWGSPRWHAPPLAARPPPDGHSPPAQHPCPANQTRSWLSKWTV